MDLHRSLNGLVKFDHPGLATTAMRSGPRLTIQNDIGETDAHVVVIAVEELARPVPIDQEDERRPDRFEKSVAKVISGVPASDEIERTIVTEPLGTLAIEPAPLNGKIPQQTDKELRPRQMPRRYRSPSPRQPSTAPPLETQVRSRKFGCSALPRIFSRQPVLHARPVVL